MIVDHLLDLIFMTRHVVLFQSGVDPLVNLPSVVYDLKLLVVVTHVREALVDLSG